MNDPFLIRYVRYLAGAFHGDFGTSYRTGAPVFDEIFSRFGITFRIGLLAIILSIVIGVPIGFLMAVFLSKVANRKAAAVIREVVDLLAGIPSVVYGLVGMMVLLPAIREFFDLPAGDSLLAAMVVLAIMILPSIISVSETALDAVPREYEEASLALGATEIETSFPRLRPRGQERPSRPPSCWAVGRAIGEAHGHTHGRGNVAICPACSPASSSSPPPSPAR